MGGLLKLLHLVGVLQGRLTDGLQLWLEDVVLQVVLVQDHLVVLLDLLGDALELLGPLAVDLVLLRLLLRESLPQELWVELDVDPLRQAKQVVDQVVL